MAGAMTRSALYRQLYRQRTLATRRSSLFTSARTDKWAVAFMVLLAACYLITMAVTLAEDALHCRAYTPTEYIMGATVFVVVIDFVARLMVQRTPAHVVKPYQLLPIRTQWLIDFFVLRSLLAPGNAIWLFFFLPYTAIAVLFPCGLPAALSQLALWWLIVLVCSQWYAIVRTLASDHLAWWLLAIGAALLLALPCLFSGRIESLCSAYTVLGSGLARGNLLPHVFMLVLLVVLVAVNRRVQMAAVRHETAQRAASTTCTIKGLDRLDRMGITGWYAKMETWSLLRNKHPRRAFVSSTALMAFISVVVCLTSVYDNIPMTDFWCLYCFSLYGLTILVRTLSYEGAYLPCLLMFPGSLERLLTGKYYLYCALLAIPFVLMLPMAFVGKWPPLMLAGGAAFTAGVQYAFILQTAVYNYGRAPLNIKLTADSPQTLNGVQTLVGLVALAAPMALVSALRIWLGNNAAWTVMLLLGLVGMTCHRQWLRSIARRTMARRYKHLQT